MSDVNSDDQSWFYTDEVKEHFFHPRNFLMDGETVENAAQGMVGSPACGDVMRVWLTVEKGADNVERVKNMKWRTFGCASAIASTSMLSVMVTENNGMTINDALAIKPQDILERLGGLPARKVHCSVLGDKALRAAINDYFRKTGQVNRITIEAGRIVDSVLKITDKDIEDAVLDGATTVEQVQARTKVGTGDPLCLPEVEQLVRFYCEKYSVNQKQSMKKISKIIVNRDLCIGAAPCVTVAPGVFQLDEENKAYVVNPQGADDDTILLAAQSCPVQAIILQDEEGNQIYP